MPHRHIAISQKKPNIFNQLELNAVLEPELFAHLVGLDDAHYVGMGIAAMGSEALFGVSTHGDLSRLDVARTLATGTPVFSVADDRLTLALPKGVLVSSWNFWGYEEISRKNLLVLLGVLETRGIPVFLLNTRHDTGFTLARVSDLSYSQVLDILKKPAQHVYAADCLEQQLCHQMMMSRDEICHFDTVGLHQL